jgi:CheY-like chemotaxis protein
MYKEMPRTGPDHANDRTSTGHSNEHPQGLVSENFVRELRTALHYLYDWTRLQRSPLANAFELAPQEDPSIALRRLLLKAIEDLEPDAAVPPSSREWRVYRLLHSRFTEQFTQIEVADELGLSIRHLRREETAAIRRLAAHLWHEQGLEEKWSERQSGEPKPATSRPVAGAPDARTPALSPREELERLHESTPPELLDVGEVVRSVAAIAALLAVESGVELAIKPSPNDVEIVAQRTSICQALTAAVVTAVRRLSGGRVKISWQSVGDWVVLRISSEGAGATAELSAREDESLRMARHLVELSGGKLETSVSESGTEPFSVTVTLPGHTKTTVLVVDDNADVLRLFERYLSGSRYQFSGMLDSQRVIEIAEETSPELIILDVMLPQVSGWELLVRLREHPATRNTPIVICTILPEEQLALDLGAIAYIRKPFTRQQLISTLDRHVRPQPTGSS